MGFLSSRQLLGRFDTFAGSLLLYCLSCFCDFHAGREQVVCSVPHDTKRTHSILSKMTIGINDFQNLLDTKGMQFVPTIKIEGPEKKLS